MAFLTEALQLNNICYWYWHIN